MLLRLELPLFGHELGPPLLVLIGDLSSSHLAAFSSVRSVADAFLVSIITQLILVGANASSILQLFAHLTSCDAPHPPHVRLQRIC
jgi:hypothetical protein